MSIYSKTQERIGRVVEDIQACQKAVESLNVDMKNEADVLKEQAQTLKEGIFQVLFTGTFDAGKSTMLNALMQKNLLKTSINAETAVVTKIIFGKEEKVIVYKKKIGADGKKLTEEYTVKDFFEKYRVSQENAALFEDVDYVQLQQPQEGIGGTAVQLVDSPGTSNSKEDTQAARDFAKKASAIVFLINAAMPFTEDDKEYIAKNFANKELKNLFFVVNRFDSVAAEEVENLKRNTKEQLKAVFTYNGQFDENMFNERVFYTNAYGSFNARLENTVKDQFGRETKYTKEDDKYTGVPEFEAALGKFLTDEDRDIAALAAYIPKLAKIYVNADEAVKKQIESYLGGVEKAQEEKTKFEKTAEEIEKILVGITDSCTQASQKALNEVKSAYDNFVTAIDVGWDEYFTDGRLSTVKFSTLDMIKLAYSKDEAKKKEKIKPIQELVKAYVETKQPALNAEITDILTSSINFLEKQLANYEEKLKVMECPVNINDILSSISNLYADTTVKTPAMKANMFQVMLSIIGSDPEIILNGMTGTTSNKSAVKSSIIANIFEYIAINIVWYPIGFIMLGKRIWDMIKGMKDSKKNGLKAIITGMKPSLMDELRSRKAKLAQDMEKMLCGSIIRSGEEFSNSFRNELEKNKTFLDNAINNLNNESFTLETEKERMEAILADLVEKISDISVLSGKNELDADSIAKLAVSE